MLSESHFNILFGQALTWARRVTKPNPAHMIGRLRQEDSRYATKALIRFPRTNWPLAETV